MDVRRFRNRRAVHRHSQGQRPPALIDAGRRAFIDAGLPETQLYYDSFDYAPDVLARILGNRAGLRE
jgi:hypothetical protein